ncbi:hypothetical protein DOTSEDRAFT_83474 [Lecanosticta acicola]|uniref:Phosphoribosylaminoimidazole-succinocarboxamide synthase n=1 Tax=Lecanosticta acicola TaxID=111012 RepID=A0AAI8YRM1_9PEZI|nr:hypothetical protein DOTSEDRAFT_83474 [Lecanosticta acicola]
MSNTLSPPSDANEVYRLRQTNVSNPSIVHSRPSQHSITASEHYYSFSGSNSSNSSARSAELANAASISQQTITRYQTPPSRYRTPLASRDILPLPQHAEEQQSEEETFRKTPMRGQGKRRQSVGEGPSTNVATTAAAAAPLLREGGIKRKPVPSTVIEQESRPVSEIRISPTAAQSSVARDINRERDAPTPGVDDSPYIHFALDQLTRDEEVRGSRRYPGIAPGIDGNYPCITPPHVQQATSPRRQTRYEPLPQEEERDIVEQAPYPDDPPPESPRRGDGPPSLPRPPQSRPQRPQGPKIFLSVPADRSRQVPLNFKPGILRPLQLGIYILLVLAYTICLVIAAAWSRAHTGLLNYGTFGDGRYFVFQYLPTMLGMVLLMWLFEIQKAVYRVGLYIAMASDLPSSRIAGATLPMQPRGFVLPYFGHFRAKQTVVGVFLFIAWLQLFTIPLLSTSFNAYQDNGNWSWIATQGVIWVVIALYILLLMALSALLFWLSRQPTGLKWDAKSLADIIVLLERSNALDGLGDGVPQLGYFRTTHQPNEVFHTIGIEEKPARSYGVIDGQIREKRYSDPDNELQPGRHSKDAMLPRSPIDEEGGSSFTHNDNGLPWFLRPSLALLWPIIAIVLLLAFLIVSYLPSTNVSAGFRPMLSSEVNTMGFNSANFLYSFIPSLLATLCLLFWLDIDLAHRRLAPFESLTSINRKTPSSSDPEKDESEETIGDRPERTLLPSYPADFPLFVSLSALFNSHLRVAFISSVSLLAATLPILAGGIFWAEFYIPDQRVLIYPDLPAYYTLTVFLTIYALAYLTIYPASALHHLPPIESFNDMRDLVHQSRLLDDIAFRNPVSKTQLVTRLLTSNPLAPHGIGAESKLSLADSIRGYGRARAAVEQQPPLCSPSNNPSPNFAFGRFQGRDGREYLGIDRVRR